MSAIARFLPPLSVGRGLIYRLAVPGAVLLVFAGFAALWIGGWHWLYFGVLRLFDADTFDFPFLDTHALLSAAECQRQGINVYIENPCDVLGRVHAYSPLWLSVIPDFLSTADTNKVGLFLDLAFIASLGIVFRPRSWRDVMVFAVAALSPITLFALERANNDILIFVLVVAAALFWSSSERSRLASYGLCLLAGLLKYYPMVLLILIVRERFWRAAALAVAAGVIILLMLAEHRGEVAMALANIPAGTYFTDSFSARDLPYGIIEMVAGGDARSYKPVSVSLLLLLSGAAIARACRVARLLQTSPIDWTVWEMRILSIASMLLAACFFTAQNMSYRRIFLLLALSGLVRLRQSVDDRAAKRWLTQMVQAALFLMWGNSIWRGLEVLSDLNAPELVKSHFDLLCRIPYWIGRELLS